MSKHLILVLFCGGFGAICLIIGLQVRTGTWKAWFATERIPGSVSPSFAFGLIPTGLLFLSMVFASMFESETRLVLFNCLGFPLLILTITLPIWQPWWILPAWYRWLKECHSDIISLLREEAQEMGRRGFQERVSTQEGLEQWIAEVRQKRGLD